VLGQDVSVDWFGTAMRPLDGGYRGETFLVGEGSGSPVVLRICRDAPERALVDASLLRLMEGIVPVPRVVEVRAAEAGQPALLVTEYLHGVSLETALAEPDRLDLAAIGRELGMVLGRLSGIPFLRPGGFVGVDLAVSSQGWPDDLRDFAQGYRDTGRLAAWSDRDWSALVALIDAAEDMLDAAGQTARRIVLVHSDFNPKNLVVDPERSALLGVVDWEFAHAGSPYADVGNVTRFERDPRLVEPLLDAFVAQAPGHLSDAFELGRAVDLWALVELAGGVPSNPVRDLATELLVAQARAGDLTAWPFSGGRVAPATSQA